jgi:hypothetical protein
VAHMNDTSSKRGRGRPAGSTSFVKIRLSDLIDNLGAKANVCVSKKWLEEIGLTLSEQVATIAPAQEVAAEEPKIDFVITNFED